MPLHDWTRVDANDYHALHYAWIGAIQAALNNGILPADYYAMPEHKVKPYVPDVLTLKTGGDSTNGSHAPAGGGVAVALAPPRVRFTEQADGVEEEQPETELLVYHARGRRLVAVIEIVSPTNKSTREEVALFVAKAVALLRTGIHFLLIDPFPPTGRDPQGLHAAVWKALADRAFAPSADEPLTLASYAALAERKFKAYVEPVAVGDVLPEMPLFLTPDLYVNVPLESTYQEAWHRFPRQLRGLLEGPAA